MNGKGILIASAAAALFLSGAVPARAEQKAGADEGPVRGDQRLQGAGFLRHRPQRVQG